MAGLTLLHLKLNAQYYENMKRIGSENCWSRIESASENKKATLRWLFSLVAGTGLEPVAFGL